MKHPLIQTQHLMSSSNVSHILADSALCIEKNLFYCRFLFFRTGNQAQFTPAYDFLCLLNSHWGDLKKTYEIKKKKKKEKIYPEFTELFFSVFFIFSFRERALKLSLCTTKI